LIPLNHTLVVPGGRFREQCEFHLLPALFSYLPSPLDYWDSKFILHGLLESELYGVANSTLQNFMDEIEQFGFIPNGGRTYYLNRSQPPVFITVRPPPHLDSLSLSLTVVQMVAVYVNRTKDVTILERALPLMEAELSWWETNRTVNITSPYSYRIFPMTRYAVNNSAPRPESYLEDYEAGNGADLATPYTDQQKADLYAEIASGAETGWDYSSRWEKNPFPVGGNLTNNTPGLRTLNVRSTIPCDLNAILCKAIEVSLTCSLILFLQIRHALT
jgi:alpha,alpha-trehalase